MLFRNILVNSLLSLSSYNYLETYRVYQFTTHLEEYWRGMECGGPAQKTRIGPSTHFLQPLAKQKQL